MFRLEVPAEERSGDEGARIDTLVRTIARRVATGGFRGRECVVSVDDSLLRTRSIRQPRMPDADVDAAVALDGASRLGFGDEASEVGWVRAGDVHQGEDVREEIIYVGAPRAPLEHVAMGLAAGGLRTIAIEPGFVALTRCHGRTLRRSTDMSVVRVLVDVGHRTTGVVLTRGCRVAFYKTLEFGGAEMTRVAAERLGLEPQAVVDLRRRRMSHPESSEHGVDPRVDRALYDAIRPLLGDLANEINLCVRHYCVTFRGSRPSACLVVGGEALEPHLTESVQDALQIETSVGQPLAGVRDVPAGVGIRDGVQAEWSVAAGLSLQPTDVRGRGRTVGHNRRRIDKSSGEGEMRGAA